MTEEEAKRKAVAEVPLPRMIAAAKRELGMRRTVYLKRVAARQMTAEQAAAGTWDMLAILGTLEQLHAERTGRPVPVQEQLL